MPVVTLKKADKLHALEQMIRAKYLKQWEALNKERAALALQVYKETWGKIGNKLTKVEKTCPDKHNWLDTTIHAEIPGIVSPHLLVPPTKRGHAWRCFFSSTPASFIEDGRVSLVQAVVKPSRLYSNMLLDPSKATVATKNKCDALHTKCHAFNLELRNFHDKSEEIIMALRNSKQVDEKFPELWEFLPDGLREAIKQGVMVIDQDNIDKIRVQVKGLKKFR